MRAFKPASKQNPQPRGPSSRELFTTSSQQLTSCSAIIYTPHQRINHHLPRMCAVLVNNSTHISSSNFQ